MNQKELIRLYLKEFGSILPAKLIGRIYQGQIFPAELSKRLREMRATGELASKKEGRFKRFYFSPQFTEKIKQINAINPFPPKIAKQEQLL